MMERSGQILLDIPDLMLLILGAASEGYITLNHPYMKQKIAGSKNFKERYHNLLTSLLIYGKVAVNAPDYIFQGIDIQQLQSEGLIEIIKTDYSRFIKKEISGLYDIAFKTYRTLEHHPEYSALVSYEQHQEDLEKYDIFELSTIEEDQKFSESRMNAIIFPLITSMSEIFCHSFDANYLLYKKILNEIIPEPQSNRDLWNIRSLIIDPEARFKLKLTLGLYNISAEEIEAKLLAYYSYTPPDLRKLDKQDRIIFDRFLYGRWEDFSSGYNILDYDDGELTQIHTLWKTLFNLVDLLKYSEENGSPIYLSTNVPVKRYKSMKDEIQQKSDLTQIYKININDMGYLPQVKSIEDVLRLREDKRIIPLRDALVYWEEEVRKGDISALAIAKKEVEKAQRKIKKLDKYIPGEIIGHAPLPIGCENYMTPFFPFGLLPIGKEESVYSKLGLKKFSWINFIMCEE